MTDIVNGTAGNDNLSSAGGDTTFQLWQGGDDTATGGAGNDIFKFASTFTALDSVDGGGAGSDALWLNGDYSAGVTFLASTMTEVGSIVAGAGFDYNLTTDDGNVASGGTLIVNAQALGAGNALTFDGAAETDGSFHIIGGAGNDVLTGGANADTFDLSLGGEDTVHGGGGKDVFLMGARFDAGDRLDGGLDGFLPDNVLRLNGDYSAGVTLDPDTIQNIYVLQFSAGHDYKLTVDSQSFLSGPTVFVDAHTLGAANFLNFDGSAQDSNFKFTGGAGNDVLTGGTAADIFDLSQGGNDTASGGALGDHFIMGNTLTAADKIDGGSGNDVVLLDGMGAQASITFNATTMVNVESLQLTTGNSYKLITNDATVAAGATLIVDGHLIDNIDALNFDGSAETDGHFILRGGAGGDLLTGGAQSDTFNLTVGGNDTAHGGGGDDTFNMAAALTAADKIDGGAGNDTVDLSGSTYGALTFGASTLTSVETLVLTGSSAYGLTTDNANVAPGARLTVDGTALTAALTFNGSFETDGGAFTLEGGAGNDTFKFASNFGNEILNGGAGSDTLSLNGTYPLASELVLSATALTSVEKILLLGQGTGNTYMIVENDANVAAGQTLTVDGSATITLGINYIGTINFDGSHETDGSFAFIGGAINNTLAGGAQADNFDLTHSSSGGLTAGGNDHVTGNGGNDTIAFGATLTATDSVDGGAGSDTLSLDGNYSSGVTFSATTVTNVETLLLAAGHDYNLTTNDATVASGQTLTVDGSALGGANVLTFNGAAETNGAFAITGGAGNDSVTLSAAPIADGSTFDGGAGNDTLTLSGDFSAGITFGAATITSVENLLLSPGHDYKITFVDANIASGGTLTVNAAALAAHTFTIDDSAETDGSMVVTAGAAFTAADSFIAGTGGSALILNGDYSGGLVFGATTAENLGDIELGGGHSYNITLNDATAAANMAVDASALGAGDTLTLDASAETNETLNIFGGAGNDFITGGQAGDVINISQGGNDTVHGGTGANEFDVGGALTGADSIDGGGGGGDFIAMAGDYTGANALVMGATTVTRIANITLGGGFSYDITTNDATVASGATLSIDASTLGAGDTLTFDGSAETDGHFAILGGAGADSFTGGNGADTFTGNGGADVFHYTAVAQSDSNGADRISDFDADAGHFAFGQTVTAVNTIDNATVNDLSASLGTAINDFMASGGAVVLNVTGGTFAGHVLLVVDANHNAAYDAGSDFVVDITGATHMADFGTANFI